ncbi:MAG: Ig domain-containing protein [Clostridia bacterium]|jgi:hypothetical protein|nr:Ig domain-containing protein [Clostridia bacterium]MCI9413208.1 Ig domain-containing protein [Clostridia bacterium]
MEKTRGVTLVALVVTIIVLLILAGITLVHVWGDNSIFKQASDAKLETELTKIEERAGLIYSDKWLEKVSNNSNNKPTMKEIVEELRKDDYTIKQVAISGNEITGISLDRESMSLGKEKTVTIKVTLESFGELYTYYVLVEGKYYKMNFNSRAVTIDRAESDISGNVEEKIILTATSENEGIATVVTNNDNNTIDVTAKSIAGTVDITVTYGNFEPKTCTVKVCEVTTELEIASVRARIAQGTNRWLGAAAKPIDTASQEFEWSSSDTEIATVDNKGVVTAKKAGTTIITVKTTDGSNLSKTCEVTIVENVPDVATLTEFQTANTVAKDSNGNLITVPGDFKVLTVEGTKVTDGIVIQDREGNEFVWVPIDSVSTGTSKTADDIRLGRYEDFTTKNATGNYVPKQDANNYTQEVSIGSHIKYTFIERRYNFGNTASKNLENFVMRTQKDGGYYLGRYEVSQGNDNKAKSQYDKVVWSGITQPDAAKNCKNMYNGSNYVESDLVNSYAWDTTIIFIQNYSKGNSNYANKISVNQTKLNTGRAGDKVCNINDMASNFFEWSTENCTHPDFCCVFRGGRYGTHGPTQGRCWDYPKSPTEMPAFRSLIYTLEVK